jgi:hypothetical protein
MFFYTEKNIKIFAFSYFSLLYLLTDYWQTREKEQ